MKTQAKEVETKKNNMNMVDTISQVADNLDKCSVEDLPSREVLVTGLKAFVLACKKKQQWHVDQERNYRDEVSSIREMLPTAENDEEEVAEKATPQRRGPRGPRGTKKLDDYNKEALKAVGKRGATKMELAKMVLDLGYTPTGEAANDLEKFAASNYTSGLFPLLKSEIATDFKVPGEKYKRYRLVK